jgi:hypothetical protein
MKPSWLVIVPWILAATGTVSAERATFDLVRYTPPAPHKKVPWEKDTRDKNAVSYTSTDRTTGKYCQIFVLRSTTSKGNVSSDFDAEWKDIIIANYKISAPAQVTDTAEQDGWTVKAGVATFAFDKGTSIAMLTTITGHDRAVSIVALTSSEDYTTAIQNFLGSVEMQKPAQLAVKEATTTTRPATKGVAKPVALQGYMDYSPFTKTWTWRLRYPPP